MPQQQPQQQYLPPQQSQPQQRPLPGPLPFPPQRLPLLRPTRTASRAQLQAVPHRRIAGVCAGLAVHLNISVHIVRLLGLLTSPVFGSGIGAYLLLWILVPSGNPWDAHSTLPASRARLASRPEQTHSKQMTPIVGGLALVGAAIVLLAWSMGMLDAINGGVIPLILTFSGAALAWSQADAVNGSHRSPATFLKLAGGTGLAAVGVLLWIARETPARELLGEILTGGLLIGGIAIVLAPVWMRTLQELYKTREAEAREAERADIAAHLHDSVLQTLTLIRRRADEPETVARLARSQERELRAWLYTDRPAPGTSVSEIFTDLAGEIEDLHGIPVEVVTVGDRTPDQETEVALAATREALSNAVRHGAPPVSLYAEISHQSLEVFVRDHGSGFDPADIAPDRHGVRESIIARSQRHGGTAKVRQLAQGTEVQIRIPA